MGAAQKRPERPGGRSTNGLRRGSNTEPDHPRDALSAARLGSQLLGSQRAAGVEEVVERLLAIQAQDARAFRLAVRVRSTGLSAAAVDAALSSSRTLVVSGLCRGTLHLVRAADYWWLHRLTAPRQLTANASRLAQLGVRDARVEEAVAVVMAEVSAGPKSRSELGSVLAEEGLPTGGQGLVHLLAAASLRAHLVRGPLREGEHCFVDAERWLGRPRDGQRRDETLATLARRYLAGHGPASAGDLARFCGIAVGDARLAFARIAGQTRGFGDGMEVLEDQHLGQGVPSPRLLGMFDPILHGWADRSFVLSDYPGVVTSNGIFRATALVAGRVAGTWSLPSGVPTISTTEPLVAEVKVMLEEEAADVLRFLGLAPAPLRYLQRGGREQR